MVAEIQYVLVNLFNMFTIFRFEDTVVPLVEFIFHIVGINDGFVKFIY